MLGLIALFTHMHIFWIAGLLLALIDLPDFGSWLGRIAGSVEKIADNQSNGATEAADRDGADVGRDNAAPARERRRRRRSDGTGIDDRQSSLRRTQELIHA